MDPKVEQLLSMHYCCQNDRHHVIQHLQMVGFPIVNETNAHGNPIHNLTTYIFE